MIMIIMKQQTQPSISAEAELKRKEDYGCDRLRPVRLKSGAILLYGLLE